MKTRLLKGNHAIVEGAIAAGCRHFFGYPITPQNEIPELMSRRMPEVGGTFLQAESEVSAINMVLGAAVSGGRVMTSSSGPGIDLKQEGIGNLIAHQLPCVIVDIMRGGPGNGALHPSQQDYNQATRGGRGDQRCLVLGPWNVQEMFELTRLAFDLADVYRNPAIVLADSVIGQVMEPVQMDDNYIPRIPAKPWAMGGAKGRPRNLSIAHFPDPRVYDAYHEKLQQKYAVMREVEQRSEEYFCDSRTEIVLVAYGVVARNALSAVNNLRSRGYPVGLFRPVTLYPFPVDALTRIAKDGASLLVVEMSAGQMAADVRLACPGSQVTFRPGTARAQVPWPGEIEEWAIDQLRSRGVTPTDWDTSGKEEAV